MSKDVSGCGLKLFSTFGCVCYITSSVLRWSGGSGRADLCLEMGEIDKYFNKCTKIFLVLRYVGKGHRSTLRPLSATLAKD